MTTTILLIIVIFLAYTIWRQRLTIDLLRGDVLCVKAELKHRLYQLDDAQREAARLRVTRDYLIRENSTLLIDLMHTERMCNFYRGRRRRVRELAAGWLLLDGWARPAKKADTRMMESIP